MATYHIKWDSVYQAVGNDGTFANPYHVKDVFVDDTPVLAVGDKVVFITDGTTEYSVDATLVANELGNANSHGLVVVPGDTTDGSPINLPVILNFSGLLSGNCWTITGSYHVWKNIHIKNGPSIGWQISNDYGKFFNCKASSCVGAGFDINTSEGAFYAYCSAVDNGAAGFDLDDSADFGFMYRCYAEGHNQNFDATVSGWIHVQCISGGTNDTATPMSGFALLDHHHLLLECLAIETADKTNTTNVFGARVITNHTTLFDNIFSGQVRTTLGNGAGVGATVGVTPDLIAGGNNYFNTDNARLNVTVGASGSDADTLDTTDPSFTAISTGDFTHTADLTGLRYASNAENLAGETDWMKGAVAFLATGGAAGGLLIHPGMSGGLRG